MKVLDWLRGAWGGADSALDVPPDPPHPTARDTFLFILDYATSHAGCAGPTWQIIRASPDDNYLLLHREDHYLAMQILEPGDSAESFMLWVGGVVTEPNYEADLGNLTRVVVWADRDSHVAYLDQIGNPEWQ